MLKPRKRRANREAPTVPRTYTGFVLLNRRPVALAAALVPLACLALLLAKTLRWPLISDAVLIHYVVLLMQHGLLPYRQIIDVNMPGSYLLDMCVTHLFGAGALDWRLFDYTLMAAAGFAMVSIVWRLSRFAGVLAASLFAITHIADGVAQAGQRDFVATVLLLGGFALLVRGARTGLRWRFVVFGVCCGAAASIKPPALVFVLLLFALDRGSETDRRASIAAGMLGALLPLAAACGWLLHLRSLGAFITLTRGLVVYHAGMARHSTGFLLAHAIPSQLLPVAALGAALLIGSRGWRDRDQRLALLAMACGLFCFWVQGKAYPYHRYPLLAFFWVWIAMLISAAFSGAAVPRGKAIFAAALAWAIVAYSVLWLAPASTAKALRYNWRYQPSLVQLQADLEQLDAGEAHGSLDRQVQCLDTMAGCITVLDRMRLVQSTGFLYDCYFFAPGASPVKAAMQQQFLEQIRRAPPRVFVVTDQWCLNLPSGYAKLAEWPAFAAYLTANYTLTEERSWSGWDRRHTATYPFGYRLYVRK
jgi:hypothetical protein